MVGATAEGHDPPRQRSSPGRGQVQSAQGRVHAVDPSDHGTRRDGLPSCEKGTFAAGKRCFNI